MIAQEEDNHPMEDDWKQNKWSIATGISVPKRVNFSCD